MSTLPGQASKGEKSKPKFQSLDINNLYKNSRGENSEKTQQKNSFTNVKYGMQSLGKVPSARRAPANLPSLKSEHSGTDAAVALIPPGGTGWGKQETTSTTNTTTTSTTTVTTASTPTTATTTTQQQQQPPQLSSHQANIALPVNVTIPPPQKQQQQQQQQQTQPTVPNVGTTDKLWSTVTIGQDSIHHPPPYQSAQFQHEFPSLSAAGVGDVGGIGNGGNTVRTNTDAQYPTGLSLRPQTEGSWTQGGAAKQSGQDSRPGSAPLGAPPQLTAQGGQQQQQQQQPPQLPPQFLGVLPPFMYKGNFGGQQPQQQQQQQQQQSSNGRNVRGDRPPRLIPDANEITPIVKMEELNRMDEIGTDMGWAGQDDIDYSQKLSFSDDESDVKKPIRKDVVKQQQQQQQPQESHYNETNRNNWQKQQQQQTHQQHEDDFIRCKKDVDQAVQRAVLRKAEEEKRFSEGTKAGAKKMLQDLEQRITKRNGENLKQKMTDIPLPDFQKEKELNEQQQQQQQQNNEEKSMNRENNFRQLTQIEGKNLTTTTNQVNRKQYTKLERDTNGPSFSRQFQNDLPPRFLKARNNSNSNLQQPQQQQQSQQQQQQQQFYSSSENRWQSGQKTRNIRQDSPIDNQDGGDYKRQSSEDSFRHSSDNNKRHDSQSDTSSSSNWHDQRRSCDERPARPDSRDSRSTRHSRDSEPRDWSESYESSSATAAAGGYDEKKHLRPVPGPITKDRIEQDDLRNEKRNLTQLKRGEKKLEVKKDDKSNDDDEKNVKDDLNSNLTSSWADSIPSALDQTETIQQQQQQQQEKSLKNDTKNDIKLKNDDYNKDRRNNRNYSTNKSWGMNEYRSSTWTKRPQTNRGHKMGSSNRPNSNEYHNTDSDGSFDERRSPKTLKKYDKDEKNLKEKQKMDKYVPKGEPTRHGRGGSTSSFRGSSRVGGLSKRIDAYGPPQTKQPFSNLHADDKKNDEQSDLSSDDKAKQNQQALSAGLTARDDKTKLRSSTNNSKIEHKSHGKSKNKTNDDNCDTNSENSDEKDTKLNRKMQFNVKNTIRNQGPPSSQQRRPPSTTSAPRLGVQRQNSMKKDDLDGKDDERLDEKQSFNGDTEGFQEVKSKKNVKKMDENMKPSSIVNKDVKKDIKTDLRKKTSGQLTQQQIQNIPSLMATPVQPPIIKNQYERPRQMKLPPRFVKAKLQKTAQMQQQQQVNTTTSGLCDVSDISKSLYGIKENNNTNQVTNASGQVSCSAWDKPLSAQIHQIEHDGNTNMLSVGLDSVKTIEQQQQQQTNVSPNHDKIIGKQQLQDKNLLDGTTPPVNTIIFENTNFKSTPVVRNTNPTNKSQRKLDESPSIDTMSGFNKPLLQDTTKSENTMQLPLSFKEDNADMKLDFFGTDLSHLTDEKTTTSTTTKNLCMSKTMHSITSSAAVNSNTICTADSLNIKIASVKKVWETPSEHGQVDDGTTSFTNSFDPNTLDPNNVFSKGNDTPDDNHEGYSPSPNQTMASTTTNVCKVKPTQQVSGSSGQTVLSSTSHQQHSGIVPPSLMGNPLSPPPMQQVIGAGVGIGQPPQQYTTNHLSYQAGLGGSTQYGMSTIPSPPTVPTVLYNSTQPLQAAQTGLYGAFQIDQTVLGNQGRTQYSQYTNHYGLGQTASSPYSTQSVYLPATPAHPPPPPPTAPDLYTNSYRLSATAPFGQNQQLNNPTTVLISSTSSNSLMSASVKPSSQQISAIGTKSGGVGQAYQQQSQQGQVYIPYDPSIQANYLSGGGVMQRAPTGPVQNNVVPAALQSSSYYSQSTGGQTGYFQQPGNSTIQSAQLQQHQTGFGLQTNVFGQHNQSHTNAGVQNYSSHFLSAPAMQMAAISAQQYRNSLPQYMKTVGNQPNIGGDQNRPQQLKSPSSQEVLSSVFNSGSQISSPKSKQNSKHPPPQSSPTAQQKYLYQGINHQTGNFIKFDQVQRYPTPIQRPVNNFQNLNVQQNNANNQKHRSNSSSNKAPNRQYYSQRNTNSTNNPSSGPKTAPIGNSGSAGGGAGGGGGGGSAGSGGGSATAPPAAEIVKDSIKEEATTLKD